jgi:hypothetical protein
MEKVNDSLPEGHMSMSSVSAITLRNVRSACGRQRDVNNFIRASGPGVQASLQSCTQFITVS